SLRHIPRHELRRRRPQRRFRAQSALHRSRLCERALEARPLSLPHSRQGADAQTGSIGKPRLDEHAALLASWSAPGDGERLWILGTLATIKVPGEASDGRFALIEFLFPRNTSPPLHTHPQDESYVVLEGRLTVQAGEHRFELDPGATAVAPMGVAHTFRVESETARVLV